MDQFGICAKYWQPGKAKTRLGATVGHAAASGLSKRFLDTLLRRFRGVAQRRVLAYTPPERRAEFAALAAGAWSLEAQAGEDLGQRMQHYFAAAFRNGVRRVVLIGSDTPTLPLEYVNKAFDLLKTYPVVLGPADDGGYYLVGTAGQVPPIFTDVAWSTPLVWSQTQSRLQAAGVRCGVLPAWYDVDDLAALRRMDQELAAQPVLDAALGALRKDIARVLDGHHA
ncbi:MAG: glycosyltransferase [Candidatus Anammoximicrobium sp.]|nr:glycosyltransferase [Candidatus Anammoximicrobium sp.]